MKIVKHIINNVDVTNDVTCEDKNSPDLKVGTPVYVDGYGAAIIKERTESKKIVKYVLESI